MKKISRDEFYETIKRKRGSKSKIIKTLDKLEVKEAIFISKEEWHKNYSIYSSPSTIIGQTFRRQQSEKKFTTCARRGEKGWNVLRIN